MYKLHDHNGFSIQDLANSKMDTPDLFAFAFYAMQAGYGYVQKIDAHTCFQLIANCSCGYEWFIQNKFITEILHANKNAKTIHIHSFGDQKVNIDRRPGTRT